jgi:restriction endonuclease S subunit
LPRLDPKLLAEYEIPLPPLTEQKRIASLMARVESLRGRMGAPQSTRQVEELFESLLAEGFS